MNPTLHFGDCLLTLRVQAAWHGIAAIALFDDVIRRCVTDELFLLPSLIASLAYPHIGLRHAACHCIRVLSRAVAVLRTNIIDNDLGTIIFDICKKEGEDRRVVNAALAALCNLVKDCSPLRPVSSQRQPLPSNRFSLATS